MAVRGFIIAIEDYTNPGKLPGIIEQAAGFRKWLIEKKQVDEKNIYACVGGANDWQTAGANSYEIINEIKRLKAEGKNKTEELYFYFSGHGFSLPLTPDRNTDAMICLDYDGPDSGRACIMLDELKEKLYRMLGPGNHYYFIDSCRNRIENMQVSVTGLGSDFSQLGTPTVYRIFSTSSGAVAKTSSKFSEILVNGLSGKGIAKDWKGNHLWVLFDRLCDFIKSQIKRQDIMPAKEGPDEGKILEILPIPVISCQIKIAGAAAADQFEVSVDTVQGTLKKESFAGPAHEIQLKPGNYFISLSPQSAGAAKFVQIEPAPSEDPLPLFDTYEIKFEKQLSPVISGLTIIPEIVSGTERLNLEDDGFSKNPGFSDKSKLKEIFISKRGSKSIGLPDGKNPPSSRLRTSGQSPKVSQRSNIIRVPLPGDSSKESAGSSPPLSGDAKPKAESIVKSILDKIVSKKQLNLISGNTLDEIKKNAGQNDPLAEANGLGLALSSMGAARIVFRPDEYKNFFRLPLSSFENLAPEQSEVYVLAGFQEPLRDLEIAAGNEHAAWHKASPVKGIKGLYEKRIPAPAGSNFLSIKIPKMPCLTYSAFCLPNRVTFFVIAGDADKNLKVHQFILPPYHLRSRLDMKVVGPMAHNPLELIKSAFLAQNQFAAKRSLATADGAQKRLWMELIYGKWLDPIMSLIGAYELIRRGELNKNKDFFKPMIANLRKYFPGLPDTEALARLTGEKWKIPSGAPLLLDGIMAFDDDEEKRIFRMPPERVDFSSFWTRWYGVF